MCASRLSAIFGHDQQCSAGVSPGHRPASDIDLTLTGHAISNATLARIDADLDDLLLPWVIDLSGCAAIRLPALLDHIERAGVLLYRRSDPPDFPT